MPADGADAVRETGRVFKDFSRFQSFQQRIVAFFMPFFDFADHAEQGRDFLKALFVGFLGHRVVHVGPLVAFAGRRVFQVFDCRGNFLVMQQFEPDFGVFLFVVRGLFKLVGNDVIAFFLGFGRIVGIFVARHRFAGKSGLQVRFGLRSFKFHRVFS